MSVLVHKLQKGVHKIKRMVTRPDPAKIKRINFAVTYRCNSRCKACSIWKKYRGDSELSNQELSVEQIKGLFNQSKYFESLDEINLTGGEPFLRKDFRNIYQFFREQFSKSFITITTNGLQVKSDWIENDEDVFRTILVFSLDGLQETNDFIRGVKGSYQRVIKSIAYYKERFPALRMGISFTLLPENYHELKKVFDLSRKLQIFFTIRFADDSKTYYGNSEMEVSWADEVLNQVERDVKSIVKQMAHSRNLLNRTLNPDLFFFSQMVPYQRKKERFFRCYSGTHSLFMDPYGNIFPCIFSEESLGNITKELFDDLWFSAKAGQRRFSIANGKCHCWTECETIPSLQRNIGYLLRRSNNETV